MIIQTYNFSECVLMINDSLTCISYYFNPFLTGLNSCVCNWNGYYRRYLVLKFRFARWLSLKEISLQQASCSSHYNSSIDFLYKSQKMLILWCKVFQVHVCFYRLYTSEITKKKYYPRFVDVPWHQQIVDTAQWKFSLIYYFLVELSTTNFQVKLWHKVLARYQGQKKKSNAPVLSIKSLDLLFDVFIILVWVEYSTWDLETYAFINILFYWGIIVNILN